jgi:hypothetical protein
MTLRISRWAQGLRWLLPGALLLAAPGAARAQGVHAALMPASQTVAPGAEFDIEIAVTQAGSPFNGFDVVVSYDPLALTFLQSSPVSLQQGCLMTGGCSAACGNTFHIFSAGGDSLKVNDALLCDQISLTGPGQIYKLRFRTSATEQVTTLSFRRAAFFNAGLFVTPLTLTGCTVTIGTVVDVGPAAAASGFGIRAQPNPFRGVVRLSVEADVAGEQDLRVIDLLGRTIRRLPAGRLEAGTRHLEWDGRNESGARAPAGIYLVQLRLGVRIRQARVTALW